MTGFKKNYGIFSYEISKYFLHSSKDRNQCFLSVIYVLWLLYMPRSVCNDQNFELHKILSNIVMMRNGIRCYFHNQWDTISTFRTAGRFLFFTMKKNGNPCIFSVSTPLCKNPYYFIDHIRTSVDNLEDNVMVVE